MRNVVGTVAIGLGLVASVGGGILVVFGLMRELVTHGRVTGLGIVLVPVVAGVLTAFGLRRRRRPDQRWLDLREHGFVH